jgi:hypothetical protein
LRFGLHGLDEAEQPVGLAGAQRELPENIHFLAILQSCA